jgi:putative ABC transport system substrate-binding protein
MNRRGFVRGGAGVAATWSLQGLAQQQANARQVGLLSVSPPPERGTVPPTISQTLQALGYIEGRSIAYEARYAGGQVDKLPLLAAELVQRKVEAIVVNGFRALHAARAATSTIPIVIANGCGDAVATGVVASLARPGGNVTGMSEEAVQLSAKRLEILKETLPHARRIAVLWNADDMAMSLRYHEIEKAADALRVEVQPLGVRGRDDFANALAAMTRTKPEAVFMIADILTTLHRKSLLEYAAANRIPAMYEYSFVVREGGLMSYGSTQEDGFRIAAAYVDRILKGAKPAELPVQQPTRYYMTLNLKTAAALGVTIPPSVLLRADEMIQ